MLESIRGLVPQPRNTFVVLPEGAEPPPERLGSERFVFAERGMMTQRLAAIGCCESGHVLFCDDDICFGPDFVRKLYRRVVEEHYSFVVGELLDLLPPRHGLRKWVAALHLAAVPLRKSDWYVKILPSGGWTYHRFSPARNVTLPTQSAAGAMFFASMSAYRSLCLGDELWAQHGGAAPAEDQIMFYKAHLNGCRVGVATDAPYRHLDAGNSRPDRQARRRKIHWSSYNRLVFWHRFVYGLAPGALGRMVASLAFLHFCLMEDMHGLLRCLIGRQSLADSRAGLSGRLAALRFVRSQEYKRIPPVIVEGSRAADAPGI